MRQSWVEKRFYHLDEQGFPKAWSEDKIRESQLEDSYSVEKGDLNELTIWKMMAATGEMDEEALRHCSECPFMEYEVAGIPDFEGLREARQLLLSPSAQQRRKKHKRRLERMGEMQEGVNTQW